jgi:hypothetical protein
VTQVFSTYHIHRRAGGRGPTAPRRRQCRARARPQRATSASAAARAGDPPRSRRAMQWQRTRLRRRCWRCSCRPQAGAETARPRRRGCRSERKREKNRKKKKKKTMQKKMSSAGLGCGKGVSPCARLFHVCNGQDFFRFFVFFFFFFCTTIFPPFSRHSPRKFTNARAWSVLPRLPLAVVVRLWPSMSSTTSRPAPGARCTELAYQRFYDPGNQLAISVDR